MAGKDDLLKRLAAQMSGLDDEAWCALASRGLLRRARKDLAGGVKVEVIAADEEKLRIRVGDRTVELGESGISGGGCDCPAAGTCQHLLAACLSLADLTGPVEAPEACDEDECDEDEWLAMEESAIRKWCGAQDFRKAAELALAQVASQDGARIVFRNGIECHLVPGAGVEGVITSAGPRHARMYAVAGILAYRESHGSALSREVGRDVSLDGELTACVATWLEGSVELGLQYLNPYSVAVARTLAMSCRTGGLHRPALELERIAQLIEWQLERHAKADSEKLFAAMADLRALVVALGELGARAPGDLKGWARTKYDERHRLELIGMGAYPWRSESGYEGVTLLFWAPEEERFVSFGDVRPKGSGFDPVGRFQASAPWRGIGSLKELANSRFFLSRPKLSEAGRLSSSEVTVVENPEACVWPERGPEVVKVWRQLEVDEDGLPGLRRSSPLRRVVVVEPSRWGKASFDDVEQHLELSIEDEEGEGLLVSLPHAELSARAIDLMEKFDFGKEAVRLLATQGEKGRLSPIAIFTRERRIDLFFEQHVKGAARRSIASGIKARALGWFGLKGGENEAIPSDAVNGYLEPFKRELKQRAEAGLHRVTDEKVLSEWVTNLDSAGLAELAGTLRNGVTAARLLKAKYLLGVLQQLP